MISPTPDYRLTFSPAAGGPGYLVTLSSLTNPTSLATVLVPAFDFAWLQTEWLKPLGSLTVQPISEEWLKSFGRELSLRLLPREILAALHAAGLHTSPTATRRLRLSFAPTLSRLAGLPWEYAFVDEVSAPREMRGFVGLHPLFRIARQTSEPTPQPLLETEQVRILIAWADPRSSKFPAMRHIPTEVQGIQSVLAAQSTRFKVFLLPHATEGSLQRELQDSQPDIIHFIGHGDVGPTGAYIALEGAQQGEARTVNSERLSGWLENTPARLVTLSACHTSSPGRSFAGELAEQGARTVLAMQLPWRDATAGQFARAFYGALAVAGDVEQALFEGRQAVQGAGPDWGVPVLYLNRESTVLFHWRERRHGGASKPPFFVPFRSNPRLVARDAMLAALHQTLCGERPRPAALIGMGGIGKTAAAAEYAHRYYAYYPGGVFWINAETTQGLQESYTAIGNRFFRDEMPEGLSNEECAARLCDIFQALDRPALLIYDNATEHTALSDLLPKVGECRLLLTTRLKWIVAEQLPDFEPFGSLNLDESAALELLQTYRRADTPEELEAAREIAGLLGCHTLALSNVAHFVRRGKSFVDYRDQLQDSPTTRLHGVFETLNIAYRDLDPSVRALLGTASCFARRSISPYLLVQACDIAFQEGAEDGILRLEDYSLLVREANQRVTLHELVHVFAQGKLAPEERSAILRRVSTVLTDTVAPLNGRQEWEAVRLEMPHCRAAAELCRKHSMPDCLVPLLRETGIFAFEHGEVQQAVHDWEEGQRLVDSSDTRSAALFSRLIAEARQVLGEHKPALDGVRQALSLAKRSYSLNAPEMAAFYNGLGYVLKMQGMMLDRPENYAKALVNYNRALKITEKSVGRLSHAYAMQLSNRGMLQKAWGEWHRAQAARFDAAGDQENSVREARQAQDDMDSALMSLGEALEIVRKVYHERHPMVAALNNNIGQTLGEQGDWQAALVHHESALKISRAVYGERHTDIASSLYYRAEALRHLGQYEEAGQSYRDALAHYEHYYGGDDRRCQTVRERLALLSDS